MRRFVLIFAALLLMAVLSQAKATVHRKRPAPARAQAAPAARTEKAPPRPLLVPAALLGPVDRHPFAHEFYAAPAQPPASAPAKQAASR